MIELDLHATKDGVIVSIHDYTVDDTTDGKGFVKNKTWAELAALEDIRREGWFDSQEPLIASLSEIFRAVSSVTDHEAEIVATVAHMISSGSVALLPDGPTQCSH